MSGQFTAISKVRSADDLSSALRTVFVRLIDGTRSYALLTKKPGFLPLLRITVKEFCQKTRFVALGA